MPNMQVFRSNSIYFFKNERFIYFGLGSEINDIVSLIKVYCSEASGDIDFDAGILESTLAEFIKIVRYLLMENERQEKMINELYQLILQFAIAYGEDPETVRNNIIQNTLESNNAK